MDPNLVRITHNFLNGATGGNYEPQTIEAMINYFDYRQKQKELKPARVAFLFICLNPTYWNLIKKTFEGSRKYFLPGHEVDYFLWSDIPEPEKVHDAAKDMLIGAYTAPYAGMSITAEKKAEIEARINNSMNAAIESANFVRNDPHIKVFPTEALPWPAGTLYRFHLFLQQEELLKKYDYIYYCDIDMKFVNYIGDEILPADKDGKPGGIVAAEHPMYALHHSFNPPYEPNSKSTAYIPRPGTIITEANGKQRFKPLYYAGGFQGGKAEDYIASWKKLKQMIDEDENKNNYHAIWNDESYWNKYLSENPPTLVLSPSFIYPDSLIKEYYEPRWGCSYPPKLITLTKDWSIRPLSPEEQAQLNPLRR